MSGETFMLTGSMGCIGAWAARNLVREGTRVVATDLATDPARPRLLMAPEELEQVTWVKLDVTDLRAVKAVVADHGVTHIVHLAGLQVPFCRANPSLGAAVNVVGTVNIFEAARAHWGQVQGLAYASSLAVLGPAELYPERPVKDDVIPHPETLYGVYKQANEGTARIYWQDWQIPSVGLRPYIVYGVARDQGMTSDIAKALLAVAAGRPYHIRFGGPVGLQYADDVARIFIDCARSGHQGAAACNLRNDVVEVGDFVALVQEKYPGAQITYAADNRLPFPYDLDDSGLRSIVGKVAHTPLAQAIDETVAMFRRLLEAGLVDLQQLES
ncbi:MAG TPA: NAD(P)-dependent oxidoreductase [Caldilineaceae bacterium]|nr:NAD(P)-dependent oxidoreductase [Caldilineaceae bacterium]